jgi:hypothetical protein
MKTRFSSRASSLYGLQKSEGRIELAIDPEEQIPGVIPDPIQPNEGVFPGTLTT